MRPDGGVNFNSPNSERKSITERATIVFDVRGNETPDVPRFRLTSVRLNFRLDISPPGADTASRGCHAEDNRNQDHGKKNGVFNGRRAIFRSEKLKG